MITVTTSMAGVLCTLLCQLTWIGMYVALVSGDGELRFNVAEEMPAGTFVGNVIQAANLASQHDAETLQQFRYGILPPSGEAEVTFFAIDETKGIISTKSQIDREQLCPHKVECSLYLDVTVSGPDNILTIGVLVDIEDINDNQPTFPEIRITLEIPESASPGISYNLPLATDLDSPLLSVQRYELLSSQTVFELKVIAVGNVPRSLQLILKEQLDREQREFYQVTLLAYDGAQPSRSGSLLIDVVIGDSNDHSPEFVNDSYEIFVPEDFTIDSTILTVQAHDQDTGVNGKITYHIAPGADNVNVDKFGIIEATGEIYVQEILDYETQKVYDLVVEARDGGINSQPAYASVTIRVEDVNDNSPQITVNTLGDHGDGNMAAILETADVGTFVAHFLVRDQDAGRNGNFSCNLQEPHFHLRQQQRSQYRLVTAAGLDRETQEHFQLTIQCQDYGIPSLSSSVEISVQVLDANDNSPVFSEKSYSVNIPENNHMEAYIIKVNATDNDEGLNAQITYHLGPEVAEYFKIDSQTGEVRANAVFDYEKLQEQAFLVTAIDGGFPARSSSVLVAVSVLDTNDEAPHFSQEHYIFEVLENQPKGLEIGIVSAVDPDSEQFSHFEFSLIPSNTAGLFDIDPKSGHMSTRATLDREDQSMYFVTVVAFNTGDTMPLSSSATITIQVLDTNDNAPVITFPAADNHTVTVSNMIPVGYQITQVEAFDLDQGNNAALKYSIDDHGQDTGFYVDSSTGVVATGVGLQNMKTQVYQVEIIVSDLGFPPKVTKQTLNISVNRSLAFDGQQLMSGTNLTIVIALAASCGAVVLILVVIIVILRSHERRKQQQHVYQCRIEEQKVTNEIEKRENNENAKCQLQGNSSSSQLENKVNLGLQYGSSQISSDHKALKLGSGIPQREADIKANAPPKPPRISVGSPQKHSSVPLPTHSGNKLWELSVKDLQSHQKTSLNTSQDDQDADSAYSGDVSNSDSGRGLSEEGENHTHGVPCGSCPGRVPNHREAAGRWALEMHPTHQAGIHYPHHQQRALSNHPEYNLNKNRSSNHRLPGHGSQSSGGILKNGGHNNRQSSNNVPNFDSYHGYPSQSHVSHRLPGYQGFNTDNRGLGSHSSLEQSRGNARDSYTVNINDLRPDSFDATSYKSVVV